MTSPDLTEPAVTLGEHSLSLAQVLKRTHQSGHLLPLLRDAAVEELVRRQAESVGLSVSDAELQKASDFFRRRNGLASSEQTRTWLASRQLSIQDLETSLERELLIDKCKDYLTRDRIAGHFAANRDGYATARLRQIIVSREDLADELLCQLRERRDFAELARRHSQHSSRGESGETLRRKLPAAVGDVVFAARAGQVVGPLATPQGFLLVLVEEIRAAELNPQTATGIREELFDAWLNEQFRSSRIAYPLLNAL